MNQRLRRAQRFMWAASSVLGMFGLVDEPSDLILTEAWISDPSAAASNSIPVRPSMGYLVGTTKS